MIKLLWAGQLNSTGNAYGYSTQANMMKAELAKRQDVTIVENLGEPYDLAVHIITPDQFHPIGEGKDLLFSMYEATSIPDHWAKAIQAADVLVVPCQQNRHLFAQYYKKAKVEVCRLGVDPFRFPFYQREMPRGELPFRFLWVGAPNPRKGFQLAIASWSVWLRTGRLPKNVQLYLKSTGAEDVSVDRDDELVKFKAAAQEQKDGKRTLDFFEEKYCNAEAPDLPGMIFDRRDYSADEMLNLYHSAHAFILPSVGEGWGLTLCEAMATGAPCVWTHWSGPKDFGDETTGFPITKFSMGALDMMQMVKGEDGKNKIEVAHRSFGAIAHCDAIIKRCEQIYHGYPAALERGKKAAARIHARFKWSDCVDEFVGICKRAIEGRKA